MAKLDYNEILPKRTILLEGDPYLVLQSTISKKDRQKASNAVKLKHLQSGNVIDRTFHQSDVVDEADIEKVPVEFCYERRGEYIFCDPDNKRDRFTLSADMIDGDARFLKEKMVVDARQFDERIINVIVPVKVHLRVTEAAEAVKGNTSSGATKEVTLETGAKLQVPQFINEGDVVAVNTETGTYTERITKA